MTPQVGFTRLAALYLCGTRVDPSSGAIHPFAKGMDPRVKPAGDEGNGSALSGNALSTATYVGRPEDLMHLTHATPRNFGCERTDVRFGLAFRRTWGCASRRLHKLDVGGVGNPNLVALEGAVH